MNYVRWKSRLFCSPKWSSRLQCHLKLSWANDCYRSCCDMFPAELGVGTFFYSSPNSLKMVNKVEASPVFLYRLFIKTFFNSHSFPFETAEILSREKRVRSSHQIKRFCTSGCNQSEWSHLSKWIPVNHNNKIIFSWKFSLNTFRARCAIICKMEKVNCCSPSHIYFTT